MFHTQEIFRGTHCLVSYLSYLPWMFVRNLCAGSRVPALPCLATPALTQLLLMLAWWGLFATMC